MRPKSSNEYVASSTLHEHSRDVLVAPRRRFAAALVVAPRRRFAAALVGLRIATALCLATGVAFAASGCATVAPYERERLAKRDMQMERNGDASAGEEHATAYREGSSGGGSSSGGGCGCN